MAGTCLLAWLETGSIAAGDWLIYAILAALLLASVLASGAAIVPRRFAALAVGFLVALACWQAISAAWSPLPSLARDDGLLTLFYAVALSLALLTVRTPAEGAVVAAAVALGTGGLAVATAVALRLSSTPSDYFVGDGRLAWPITYPNAAAAMFLVGFWPALVLASTRRLPVALRALALGSATAVLAGWLLTQSKGGGIAIAISAVVVFAVVPNRLRLLVPALIVAVLGGSQFRPLTAPFNAGTGFHSAAHHAGSTLLWLTAVAVVAGAAYALLDRRLELPARAVRAAGALALGLVVAAAIAVPATFFASVDHPGRYAAEKWHSFKHLPTHATGSTHFITLGSNRYDFWRVALHEFGNHPLAGIGARGFGPAYLIEGHSDETPARTHSIELDALGELGIVGFLLLAGALVPLFGLAFRGLRRRELPATAAFASGVYWLVHASADWNWTIPAVGLPFFLLLGAGAGAGSAEPGLLRARVAVPAAATAALVALLAFAPPWISARLSAHALRSSSSATSSLRWARRLDPLSVQPYVVQSDLARSPAGAVPPLRQAVGKQPRSVDLHYALALAYLRALEPRAARLELLAAERLAPRDASIHRALSRLRHG